MGIGDWVRDKKFFLETGLVLESGSNSRLSVPIIDGYISGKKIKRLDIAGNHITSYLSKLLQLKGYNLFYYLLKN